MDETTRTAAATTAGIMATVALPTSLPASADCSSLGKIIRYMTLGHGNAVSTCKVHDKCMKTINHWQQRAANIGVTGEEPTIAVQMPSGMQRSVNVASTLVIAETTVSAESPGNGPIASQMHPQYA
jgi:hypothetical protein